MKCQHYFHASAKFILVARDELSYLKDLTDIMGDIELSGLTHMENFGLTDADLSKVAFDDEDLLVMLTKSSEDAQACSVSKTSLRPYGYAAVMNLSIIIASRRGRTLNISAVEEIAEKLIIGIGHTLKSLYVEYQLGIGAETKVSLLYGSADYKYEATDEELEARKKQRIIDAFNALVNLVE